MIGGPTRAHGNLISGNASYGIFSWAGTNLTIENNLIGTNLQGNAAIANDSFNIRVQESLGVTISENVVASNAADGIHIIDSRFTPTMAQWKADDGGNDHYYLLPGRAGRSTAIHCRRW